MASIRHITLAAGFKAAGVKAGIKASGKEDVAIVACDHDCAVAVVTTRNQVVGEPVKYIRRMMPKGYGVGRAMVVNSGCSNVCTGRQGARDAAEMAKLTAKLLDTTAPKVLVASTGIIGHKLPMAKVRAGIEAAASQLSRDADTQALRGIMTTDTREKYAVVQARVGGKLVTIGGMVKGSGMIAPSMATMIGIITTDAAVAPAALHKALTAAVGVTFNAITVDSDTSTSDTVAVFASGDAGNKAIAAGSADFAKFASALREVCGELARAIVIDGEGATKLVEIAVRGARSDDEAAAAAKSVANSPLVKCAIHGGDPNWGRILAGLGKSPAKIDQDRTVVKLGGVKVFARGVPTDFDVKAVEKHLAGKVIRIDCDLGLGRGAFTALTCDLSREYITINADYHT